MENLDEAYKLSEQKKTIGKSPLKVLDESVEIINGILENNNTDKKRLHFSEVKNLKLEINSLIEYGKDLFLKADTKADKEDTLEQILVSIDYLFAKINASKVFIRYPIYDFFELSNLPIANQLLSLMKPSDYNLSDLDSIVGGNCYSYIIALYDSILKEIVGGDEDISIKFQATFNDHHSFISINNKYYLDFGLSGDPKHFYNIEKDGIKDDSGAIETSENSDEFVLFKEKGHTKKIVNISVGGKKGFKLKIQYETSNISSGMISFEINGIDKNINIIGEDKGNDEDGEINLIKSLLNFYGIDELLADDTFKNKFMNLLDLEVDRIILEISKIVTNDEKEQLEIMSAISLYDKNVFLKVISGFLFKDICFNDRAFRGRVILS